MSFGPLGKILIITGAAIIILGVALLFFDRIPVLGKLPGGIMIKRKNFTFYFPLATSLLLSIILSVIFFIVGYFRK